MNDWMRAWMVLGALLIAGSSIAAELTEQTYERLVDGSGKIRLAGDYRLDWSHLGSWVVAAEEAPGYGFHDVYTQPEAVRSYREQGSFPDGAVLIKEIREVEAGTKTTGDVQWAGPVNAWFVMVRDARGRFPESPHWAEGWGWALFEAKDPGTNVSKGFAETCKGCHVPAMQNNWVFIEGYPTLSAP